MKIQVYTLAWDNDGGCGCEIYATREARDAALRESLLSYVTNPSIAIDGRTFDFTLLDTETLAKLLDSTGRLDGARYASGVQSIDIATVATA